MEDQKLTIELTVAQWNGILAVLGQRPFAEVAGIIGEIKAQADPQIGAIAASSEEAA